MSSHWLTQATRSSIWAGLSGDFDNLFGASNWTNSADNCLDIQDFLGDLGVEVNEEQEADELADVGGGDGTQKIPTSLVPPL